MWTKLHTQNGKQNTVTKSHHAAYSLCWFTIDNRHRN